MNNACFFSLILLVQTLNLTLNLRGGSSWSVVFSHWDTDQMLYNWCEQHQQRERKPERKTFVISFELVAIFWTKKTHGWNPYYKWNATTVVIVCCDPTLGGIVSVLSARTGVGNRHEQSTSDKIKIKPNTSCSSRDKDEEHGVMWCQHTDEDSWRNVMKQQPLWKSTLFTLLTCRSCRGIRFHTKNKIKK